MANDILIDYKKMVEAITTKPKYQGAKETSRKDGIEGSYESIFDISGAKASFLVKPTIYGDRIYMVVFSAESDVKLEKDTRTEYTDDHMLDAYGVKISKKEGKTKLIKIINVMNDMTPEYVLSGIEQFLKAKSVMFK